MLTNYDLEVLLNIYDVLDEIFKTYRDKYIITLQKDLENIIIKLDNYKKEHSQREKERHRKDKKYHNLINSLYYHRKRGNQARVKELEEKLAAYKNPTI